MTNQKVSATDMTDEEYNEWLRNRLAANPDKSALGELPRGAPKRTAESVDRPKEEYPQRDV